VLEDSPPTDLRAIEPNELVRRAHAGCADSFTELSRRFRPRLLCLVERRLGGHRTDAEDVAQEALARAFQHLDRFDPQRQFSTWLYTIAIRLTHDHARRRRRRPPQVALDVETCAAADAGEVLATQRTDEIDNVWQLAKRLLPEAQFTAMWLRYGEDRPAAEVSRIMRRSRIGVRVLLHRARARLVAELVEQDQA
jgi:RNA polymerase sigma-70 factor (ECF subfamily)